MNVERVVQNFTSSPLLRLCRFCKSIGWMGSTVVEAIHSQRVSMRAAAVTFATSTTSSTVSFMRSSSSIADARCVCSDPQRELEFLALPMPKAVLLIEQLREDEAIAQADTLSLTSPIKWALPTTRM
jgi:hypothetical protein